MDRLTMELFTICNVFLRKLHKNVEVLVMDHDYLLKRLPIKRKLELSINLCLLNSIQLNQSKFSPFPFKIRIPTTVALPSISFWGTASIPSMLLVLWLWLWPDDDGGLCLLFLLYIRPVVLQSYEYLPFDRFAPVPQFILYQIFSIHVIGNNKDAMNIWGKKVYMRMYLENYWSLHFWATCCRVPKCNPIARLWPTSSSTCSHIFLRSKSNYCN